MRMTSEPAANAGRSRAREIRELGPWFHNLHLPDGTQTAPDHELGDFPANKWERLGPCLARDLTGWRVLDVGCNAGFYSFALARRGASVLGIDVEARYLAQARWACDLYGLRDRVSFRRMHVYSLARQRECFDLVVFMGVFYHLRYPALALDIVARKARRLLVFQSLSVRGDEVLEPSDDGPMMDRARFREPGWPKMAFVEGRFAGDPTNWWVPNRACAEALLRSAGLRVEARPTSEIYVCRPDPHLRRAVPDERLDEEFLAACGGHSAARPGRRATRPPVRPRSGLRPRR